VKNDSNVPGSLTESEKQKINELREQHNVFVPTDLSENVNDSNVPGVLSESEKQKINELREQHNVFDSTDLSESEIQSIKEMKIYHNDFIPFKNELPDSDGLDQLSSSHDLRDQNEKENKNKINEIRNQQYPKRDYNEDNISTNNYHLHEKILSLYIISIVVHIPKELYQLLIASISLSSLGFPI